MFLNKEKLIGVLDLVKRHYTRFYTVVSHHTIRLLKRVAQSVIARGLGIVVLNLLLSYIFYAVANKLILIHNIVLYLGGAVSMLISYALWDYSIIKKIEQGVVKGESRSAKI